jgi:aspartate ammonia-lyase
MNKPTTAMQAARDAAQQAVTRTEHDFLGEKQIPSTAYWGVHTARALENFPISGTPISAMPDLIRGFGLVKKAAARANTDLGALDDKRSTAIVSACNALIAGQYLDQFVVDVIQGGAGTSTNMNANEVIANIALEKLGHEKGRYDVLHPNDHVNASQSTNDVYPTAVRIALWMGIDRLLSSMHILQSGFAAKADEFKDVLKIGRTQLQDAVPMTLGQEFSTYAVMLEEDILRLREALCRYGLPISG